MTVYIALLRGINVGGKHILPMQDLRNILGELGCEDVQTYIQSGNAVFRSKTGRKTLAKKITSAIDRQFGFAPRLHLLTREDLHSILSANPFPEAVDTPKFLHVAFLFEETDNPDLAALEAIKSPTERFKLGAQAFYLHAPDGIGRSKLVEKVDKFLGVETTGRNWRTASRIAAMAAEIPN